MTDSPDKEISTDLTLSDLKTINTLIEGISQKGLIKPNDFSVIGSIYEKINMILSQSSK